MAKILFFVLFKLLHVSVSFKPKKSPQWQFILNPNADHMKHQMFKTTDLLRVI